eukprot:Nk52_evm32s224 gene=Nk52_evmTU32s224
MNPQERNSLGESTFADASTEDNSVLDGSARGGADGEGGVANTTGANDDEHGNNSFISSLYYPSEAANTTGSGTGGNGSDAMNHGIGGPILDQRKGLHLNHTTHTQSNAPPPQDFLQQTGTFQFEAPPQRNSSNNDSKSNVSIGFGGAGGDNTSSVGSHDRQPNVSEINLNSNSNSNNAGQRNMQTGQTQQSQNFTSRNIVYESQMYSKPDVMSQKKPRTEKSIAIDISKSKSPETLRWILDNYEENQGHSLPRCQLFELYQEYCKERGNITPLNPASFGKMIKAAFPDIKTRRLGTRGQSKYHYFGIGPRQSSKYYHISQESDSRRDVVATGGTQEAKEASANDTTMAKTKSIGFEGVRLTTDTRPEICEFAIPKCLVDAKSSYSAEFQEFVPIYREHCQNVLDAVFEVNSAELDTIFVNFYRTLKAKYRSLLCSGDDDVINCVLVYDSLLYNNIWSLCLEPSYPSYSNIEELRNLRVNLADNIRQLMEPLPMVSTQYARFIAKHLEKWLRAAFSEDPEQDKSMYPPYSSKLISKKCSVARSFAVRIKRQTSLSHLIQAANPVLSNDTQIQQMHEDWMRIDFEAIYQQVLWASNCKGNQMSGIYEYSINTDLSLSMDSSKLTGEEFESVTIKPMIMKSIKHNFENLMCSNASLSEYLKWLLSLGMEYLKKNPMNEEDYSENLYKVDEYFLTWSLFTSAVMRDLTLRSSASFGSFHLTRLLFDEYIMHILEMLRLLRQDKALLASLQW